MAAAGGRGGASPDVRRPAPPTLRAWITAVQLATALWLLAAPFALPGPNVLVGAKDLAVGTVLLVVSIGAWVDRSVREVEGRVCLALGVLLVVASIGLEFGSGTTAAARQWNEVVVGVLLVCLSTARVR